MNDKDKKEIAEMIAASMTEHKKEKTWFAKLGIVPKILTGVVAFGISVSALGTGVSWFLELLFHEEINQYELMVKDVEKLKSDKSDIEKRVDENARTIDTLNIANRQGSKFYAVGYRAEKKEDGSVIKYYRDWNGIIYPIFPDPNYSTTTFTYWFFNNPDGTKEYTFGR